MKNSMQIALRLTATSLLFLTNIVRGDPLAVSLPLVSAVKGVAGIRYATAIDITNSTSVEVPVDFYFTGIDQVTHSSMSSTGTIGDFGPVTRGSGAMSGGTKQHFDDFIDALVGAGMLPSDVQNDGITGSLLLVFQNTTGPADGQAVEHFYDLSKGLATGIDFPGHVFSTHEATVLTATIRDTRASSGDKTYPNVFINNTGVAADGTSAGYDTVLVSAMTSDGQSVGISLPLALASGETATLSQVFQRLGISNSDKSAIVITATIVSGTGVIQGVVSQVNPDTHVATVSEMSQAR
jgi:hypothetical protein